MHAEMREKQLTLLITRLFALKGCEQRDFNKLQKGTRARLQTVY